MYVTLAHGSPGTGAGASSGWILCSAQLTWAASAYGITIAVGHLRCPLFRRVVPEAVNGDEFIAKALLIMLPSEPILTGPVSIFFTGIVSITPFPKREPTALDICVPNKKGLV